VWGWIYRAVVPGWLLPLRLGRVETPRPPGAVGCLRRWFTAGGFYRGPLRLRKRRKGSWGEGLEGAVKTERDGRQAEEITVSAWSPLGGSAPGFPAREKTFLPLCPPAG
jgi:hypothetical protein